MPTGQVQQLLDLVVDVRAGSRAAGRPRPAERHRERGHDRARRRDHAAEAARARVRGVEVERIPVLERLAPVADQVLVRPRAAPASGADSRGEREELLSAPRRRGPRGRSRAPLRRHRHRFRMTGGAVAAEAERLRRARPSRPGTCRPPASPRSCQPSSQTWKRPCAVVASPKERKPPLGLIGSRPRRQRVAALEQRLGLARLAEAPLLGERQLVVDGVVLQLDEVDVRRARCPPSPWPPSPPPRPRCGTSCRPAARRRRGRAECRRRSAPSRPCWPPPTRGFVVRFRAKSAEQITTAAAPSLTGQISKRRSG